MDLAPNCLAPGRRHELGTGQVQVCGFQQMDGRSDPSGVLVRGVTARLPCQAEVKEIAQARLPCQGHRQVRGDALSPQLRCGCGFLPSDRSCGLGPLLHSLRNCGFLLLGRHSGIAVTAFAESSGAVRKHVIATIYAIATILWHCHPHSKMRLNASFFMFGSHLKLTLISS